MGELFWLSRYSEGNLVQIRVCVAARNFNCDRSDHINKTALQASYLTQSRKLIDRCFIRPDYCRNDGLLFANKDVAREEHDFGRNYFLQYFISKEPRVCDYDYFRSCPL